MSIYIPYFYIIRHINSGKMYAGSRYAKGCNPDELLKEDGYQTSSNIIKKIISKESLNSFEILRIDTYCDGHHPYDYETLFLEINDCARSDNWFNTHNNKGACYGTEKYKSLMLEKYGVDNPSKVKEIKQGAISKNIEKYGFKVNILGIIDTMLEKYGVDNTSKLESTKLKKQETCFKNFNVNHPGEIDKIREINSIKMKNTNSSISVCCIYCKKESSIPNFYQYHDEYCKLNPNKKVRKHNKGLKKGTILKRLKCPHCHKEGASNTIKRYHFDNCKLKPPHLDDQDNVE